MIEFIQVSKVYPPGFVALNDVTFKIREKEFVTIVGRSGAGKSTLLRMLIGEEMPTDGEIYIGGDSIKSFSYENLPFLRRKIGTIFQDYKLLGRKTVFENIAFALEVSGKSDEEIAVDVPQALEIVGLRDKTDYFPYQLSGGEKQRAAIARALIHRPAIILADEPTGNLDLINTWEIIRLLLKINELGTTVILATHDRDIVNTLERRVVTLEHGKIIRDDEKGRYVI